MNPVLASWNQLQEEAATKEILPCCGSHQWAQQVARSRPVIDETALFELSDTIWFQLGRDDWDEAFASHPRIGERKIPATATAMSGDWSRQEQSGVEDSESSIQERLRVGNAAYEKRFGRTYIVCATGKSAGQMLAILERRLGNNDEQELREALEQQSQITQIRLRKWLHV